MSSEVYVCFTEANRPKWFMRFLRKGFSHCFVLEPYKGKWVRYEYGHFTPMVAIFDDVQEITKSCIIVKCKKSTPKRYFMTCSCVGFVKFIIGDKSLAITPYQLYRSIKNGIA